MKNKKFLLSILLTFGISLILAFVATQAAGTIHPPMETTSAAIQNINAQIAADGSIHSQNEATLHFQTGGKLVYLPVKEGDTVYTGQTIGQLDTYGLQRQLAAALNSYRSTRDTFDQTQANNQNGLLQGSQQFVLNSTNSQGSGYKSDSSVINDMAKRIVDQNQANLDNSVINVELATYALQLATLTSPINGVVTHEDVTVANQNITPVTSFSVADPTTIVFRANVLATDIDFVSEGSLAQIKIDGVKTPFSGTVVKVYPQKTTLSSGLDVYAVDIQSDSLKPYAKFGQNGSVLVQSNTNTHVVMVPVWTILGHEFVWVEEKGNMLLKKVDTGKVHGNLVEITNGLSNDDRVITDPAVIAKQKYSIL